MTCPDCERYKQSAAMWRNKAYELGGTPLPWEPEELLRKEYERGYDDAKKAFNSTTSMSPTPPKVLQPVQVSPLEFVTMTLEKEHLIGRPIIWAQWPNEEKNT